MLPANYRFAEYQTGDEVAINTAFNEVFAVRRSLSEWEWKFRPAGGPPGLLMVKDERNRIVAHYAAMSGLTAQVDGRRFRVGQAGDVFCKRVPGSARHRIYVKLVVEFLRRNGSSGKFPLLYGFPNQKAFGPARLKAGYPEAAYIPVRSCRIQRRILPWRPFRVGPPPSAGSVDELWNRAGCRYPVALVRDSNWLHRRYSSHPSRKYLHLTVQRTGKMAAWGVFLQQRRTIHWIDLVWDGGPEALAELAEGAQRLGLARGARQLLMWLQNDAEAERILEQCDWVVSQEVPPIPFVALSFDPALDHEDFMSRFYITMAVSDHV